MDSLSVAIGRVMLEHESLIVFNEVQLCPRVRQMIKYLVGTEDTITSRQTRSFP